MLVLYTKQASQLTLLISQLMLMVLLTLMQLSILVVKLF